MSTYCRTHGRLYTEHVCDRPHDPTPSERRDLADSTEWPPVERVRAAVASLNAQTENPTPEPREALTEPYSKPKVVPIIPGFGGHVEWFVVTNCCPLAPGEEPPDDYSVWDWHFPELGEAMDAALAHVNEVHRSAYAESYMMRRYGPDASRTWAHGYAMDADTLADPVARQILDGETSDDDWLEVPTFTWTYRPDPVAVRWTSLAAATCWCGRICCRHHRDDPDPAQAIWADIYNQPGGSRA